MTGENTAAEEVAAPLDMLLIRSATGFGRRMVPNGAWVRTAGNLIKRPGTVASRVGALVGELTDIALGASDRAPGRADKRFADPAWSQNPVLQRVMQTDLATTEKMKEASHERTGRFMERARPKTQMLVAALP